MRILCLVKRVPITGGKMVLTADEQAIETKHLGFTISPHEECGVEEAVRIVEAQGGEVVVLTLGPPEAEDQLRECMALGADRAIHLVSDEEWDAQATALALVDAIRTASEEAGEPFDLIVFGNESADAGNYQVGIRVAYSLGLPVVTGLKGLTVADGRARCEQEVAVGRDVYDVPLPAVVTVKEGLNLPRYPSVPAKLRANRKPVDARPVERPASRLEKLRLVVPAGSREGSRGARPWPGSRARRGRGAAEAGRRMNVLVFVEPDDELSLQAVTLAQSLGDARAVSIDGPYAPGAWAAALIDAAGGETIVAPGSDRGNEVLAHVAARLDLPFAANVTEVRGDEVTRQRWGGTLLEEARVHAEQKLLTAAPFAFGAAALPSVEVLHPDVSDAVQVIERVVPDTGGKVSLADAKVVVSGGRGVGSAGGLRDPRGTGRTAGGRRRLLARRDERGLAPAYRPGRANRDEGVSGHLHRLRDQRGDAAHRRLQGGEEAARHQRRSRGDDLHARRLCGDRQPARDRSRDLRRAQEGATE